MAQPPSFYGPGPRIARLPQPIDTSAPLREGLDDLTRAATRAQASAVETEQRVSEMDLQTRRIERDRELQRQTGDRAVALADAYGQLQVDLVKMRTEAGPGADGHEQRAEERIALFRDQFMGTLGNDPELTARFADNVASFAASARVAEVEYAAKSRAEKSVNDFGTLRETLANQINTRAGAGQISGQDLANARALWDRAVEAAPLPDNAKEEQRREGYRLFSYRAAEGAMLVNPQAVIDQLDAGSLDADLTGNDKTTLRGRAQALLDKAQREAASQADEGVKVARAQARVMIESVDEGVEIDGDALQQAHARAAASMEPEDIALAHDLENALARNLTTQSYDKSSIAERQAAQREIETTSNWQKDVKLVAAHKQLGVLIERDKREAKADPLTLYVRQSGQAAGEANVADRAAMAERFTMGDRVAARYPGTPPTHLFEQEAQQLREQWNTGTPHARADMVQLLGGYGPKRGRELMRQLAPSKPEYARLVELASFRDPAIKGLVREALDGWAQPPSKAVDSGKMAAEANRLFGSALAKIPGDRRAAIMQVASGIYGHRAAQGGRTAFDKELWGESVAAALGGVGGRGGFGKASSGETFILPGGLSQQDWGALIGAASGIDLADAAGGHTALWSSGQKLSVGELKQLTPVLVSDSGAQALYAFRSRSGGYVRRVDGGDFVLDFRALARLIGERRGR